MAPLELSPHSFLSHKPCSGIIIIIKKNKTLFTTLLLVKHLHYVFFIWHESERLQWLIFEDVAAQREFSKLQYNNSTKWSECFQYKKVLHTVGENNENSYWLFQIKTASGLCGNELSGLSSEVAVGGKLHKFERKLL